MITKFNKLKAKLKPNKFTKLICAQIRIGGEYGIGFMSNENTKDFWKFINDNFFKRNNNNYKLFITSDKPYVIDEAYKQFDNDKLVAFRNNSFHINFKDSCADFGNLIMDFSLLSLCDMGVISHSGFGFVGIMNQENFNSNNFYVFTNPVLIKKAYWDRRNLSFYQFDKSFLYFEFDSKKI